MEAPPARSGDVVAVAPALPSELFVGRERELTELRDGGIRSALAGNGRLFLLSGEPGAGKTRLAQVVSNEAAAVGFAVYWGRCWEAGGAPPYWPWLQVLRDLFSERDAAGLAADLGPSAVHLSQLVPELRELITEELPAAGAGDKDRFALFDAVGTSLRGAARRQPLLLVFDDLHAADATSLLLLQFVARALRSSRALLLGSYRDVPESLDVAGLGREGDELALRGLARPEVAAFLEAATGLRASEALTTRVYEASGGNPLFVNELVRSIPVEPEGEALSVRRLPAGVRQAVRRRLDPLGPVTTELLALASVVGREFSVTVLEALVNRPHDEILERLEEAVRARVVVEVSPLLGRYAFTHDLVRETLYEDLGPQQRREAHVRVGEALEPIYSGDPEPHFAELAHHFVAGGPRGDVERAISYSRRAGEAALAQLAYEEAARHHETAVAALEAMPGREAEERRCDSLMSLGEARMRGGETAEARDALLRAAELARRLADPARLAHAGLVLAAPYAEAGFGDPARAMLLEEALASLPVEDGSLRASLLARLAPELFWFHDFRRADDVSAKAVEMAQRIGDPATLLEAMDCRHYALMRPETLQQRLALADELVRLADEARAVRLQLRGRVWRIHNLLESGDMAAVDDEVERQARLADLVRQPGHRWVTTYLRAMRRLLEGRLDEAEYASAEALEIGQQAGIVDAAAVHFMAQRYQIVRHRGGAEEIEEPVRAVADAYGELIPGLRAVLASVWQMLGREQDARREYERLVASASELPRDHNWLGILWVLADLCVALRDSSRAGGLYELLRPFQGRQVVVGFAGGCAGPVDLALARLATLKADHGAAAEHFEAALELTRLTGARAYEVEVRADYAAMLMVRSDAGDRQKAQELMAAAAAGGSAMGLTRVVERCGPPPTAAVFRREGDVWHLAYAGRETRLKDSKGLGYIRELLANPNTEIAALALAAGGQAPPAIGYHAEPGLRAGGLGGIGDLLDAEAKAAYRRRLDALTEELEEAEAFGDPERAARARDEVDLLAAELARATGRGGRGRAIASPAERARVNVTKTIRQSLRRIAEEHEPLGDHLAATIRTGMFCCYLPGPRVPSWQL